MKEELLNLKSCVPTGRTKDGIRDEKREMESSLVEGMNSNPCLCRRQELQIVKKFLMNRSSGPESHFLPLRFLSPSTWHANTNKPFDWGTINIACWTFLSRKKLWKDWRLWNIKKGTYISKFRVGDWFYSIMSNIFFFCIILNLILRNLKGVYKNFGEFFQTT